jgi:hypothetical protein
MQEQVSLNELVQLCAVDGNMYAKTFFPNTARQGSPAFHNDMDTVLENPANRFVGFKVFRGGAKTTKLRLFCSKRIAYGISHTILFVGKSQDHAIKSIHWLKRAVEFNRKWAGTFNLRKGEKWSDTEIEILHGTDDYPIRVIALGITGSVRGINVDDYRPDLIILDDPCDEENTATPEARQKMSDLVFGALAHSLAPASEAPDATMALAQTPLDAEDLIENAMKDPQWATVKYSCYRDNGHSAWPQRWTQKELDEDKAAHVHRNQLSLWLREMECEVVTSENAAFKESWLEYYDLLPEGGITYIAIDPTPPPKEGNALKVVNEKLDDAVIMVIRFYGGKVYVCEYWLAKSPDPDELVNEFFRLCWIWKPMLVGVETTLFQRMLKWYLDKEMLRRQLWYTVIPIEDKRKKSTRITQTVTRYASNGNLVVHKGQHPELIQQYIGYRAEIQNQRDDMLDALTIGMDLINPALEGVIIEGEFTHIDDESRIPELEHWQSAP